jgi:hypothetical protein
MDGINVSDAAEDLVDRLKPGLEDAKGRLESLNVRVKELVKEHPGACLLGALALGYLVARLARREQS